MLAKPGRSEKGKTSITEEIEALEKCFNLRRGNVTIVTAGGGRGGVVKMTEKKKRGP